MHPDHPLLGEPRDTRDAIMQATFRALRQHGYAGLSIQRIADEAGLSKGSFYNHYDGKDDLLVSFLDYMLEHYRTALHVVSTDDPAADLRRYLTTAISGDGPPGISADELPGEDAVLFGPLIELRAQAVNTPAFRTRISNLDDVFRAELTDVIERGIAQGQFRDVDPDRTADLLLTLLMGTVFRRGTTDNYDSESVQAAVDDLLDTYLLAD